MIELSGIYVKLSLQDNSAYLKLYLYKIETAFCYCNSLMEINNIFYLQPRIPLIFIVVLFLVANANVVKRQAEDGSIIGIVAVPDEEPETPITSQLTPATQNPNDYFGSRINIPNLFNNINSRHTPFDFNWEVTEADNNVGSQQFDNNRGFLQANNYPEFAQNSRNTRFPQINFNFTSPRYNLDEDLFDPLSSNGDDNYARFLPRAEGNVPAFSNFHGGGTGNNYQTFWQDSPFSSNRAFSDPFVNSPNTPNFPTGPVSDVTSSRSPAICATPDQSPFGDRVSNNAIPE